MANCYDSAVACTNRIDREMSFDLAKGTSIETPLAGIACSLVKEQDFCTTMVMLRSAPVEQALDGDGGNPALTQSCLSVASEGKSRECVHGVLRRKARPTLRIAGLMG